MNVLCIYIISLTFSLVYTSRAAPVELVFVADDIVPERIQNPPQEYAKVEFPGGVQVALGNVLTPCQIREPPQVSWPACSSLFYTLLCVDIDATSPMETSTREELHWLVANIPGGSTARGDELVPWDPPGPPKGSGSHRYVFLIFRQSGMTYFPEPTYMDYTRLSVAELSKKYRLGDPVAGNYFQSQYFNECC